MRTPFGRWLYVLRPLSLKGAKSKAGVAAVTLCAGDFPETPCNPGGRADMGSLRLGEEERLVQVTWSSVFEPRPFLLYWGPSSRG